MLIGKEYLEFQKGHSSLKEKIAELVNEDNDEFCRRINESIQDNNFKDQFNELIHASDNSGTIKSLKKTDSYGQSEILHHLKPTFSNDYKLNESKSKYKKFVNFMCRHKTLPNVLVILLSIILFVPITIDVPIHTSLGALMRTYHLFNKKKRNKKNLFKTKQY
ncbi:hypothetical protein MKS88_001058 [Plasmodium brasilianum]|uniref:Uncharacterized protein n=1 Tax=Plasmodium brasilianum TaxID=5824 RepID=A0ACB9YEJ8_PLABR|nr:hypothetical protein MKS88_001058 [Plasmodium brasilianum]